MPAAFPANFLRTLRAALGRAMPLALLGAALPAGAAGAADASPGQGAGAGAALTLERLFAAPELAGAGLRGLRFSPDGKRLAFVASTGQPPLRASSFAMQTRRGHRYHMAPSENPAANSVMVVVDGVASRAYAGIDDNSMTFSPDGRRFGYVAMRDNVWRAVVDGIEEEASYDDVAPYMVGPTLHFSPDGNRLAYVALRKETDSSPLGYRFKWFVVADRQKGKEYNRIGEGPFQADTVAFDTEGKRLAYVARKGDGHSAPAVPIIDGVEGAAMTGILQIDFLAGGGKIGMLTFRGRPKPYEIAKMRVEIDGAGGGEQAQLEAPFVASPDGTRVAVVAPLAKRGSETFKSKVIVDAQEGATYRSIASPVAFSPDSRHFAYRAVLASGKESVLVVDGVEGPTFPVSPEGMPLCFVSNRRIHWATLQGRRVVRIEVELPQP